jgi:hypothetical protein
MYLRGLKVSRGRTIREIVMIPAADLEPTGLAKEVQRIEKKMRWIPDMTVVDFQSDYERQRFKDAA